MLVTYLRVTGIFSRVCACHPIFSCIPCAANERAVENKCEVIPEDEIEAETNDETNDTTEDNTSNEAVEPADEASNAGNNEASNQDVDAKSEQETDLNCKTSQVIANGVCTYCAINYVINLGDCVQCSAGQSNVDNYCSDKGISFFNS